MASINLTLAAMLVWAGTERAELRVEVTDLDVVATLGTAQLRSPLDSAPTDLAVALAPRANRPLATPSRDAHPIVAWLLDWLSGGLEAGIEGATVQRPQGSLIVGASGTVWQETGQGEDGPTDSPGGGWSIVQDETGTRVLQASALGVPPYRLTVPLVRPSATVRVVLRSVDGAERTVVASPDGRTLSIASVPQSGSPTATSGGLFAYKRDATAWAQGLWRELARPWLFALALVGAGRALATQEAPSGRSRAPDPKARGGAALSLGGLAVCATLPVAALLLERIPNVQDDVTYLFQAQLFALGRLSAPAPPLPEFFEQEFVLMYRDQWFGKYPPGQPLMLALGLLAGAP